MHAFRFEAFSVFRLSFCVRCVICLCFSLCFFNCQHISICVGALGFVSFSCYVFCFYVCFPVWFDTFNAATGIACVPYCFHCLCLSPRMFQPFWPHCQLIPLDHKDVFKLWNIFTVLSLLVSPHVFSFVAVTLAHGGSVAAEQQYVGVVVNSESNRCFCCSSRLFIC